MSTTLRVKVKDRWYTVEVGDLSSNPVPAKVDGDLVEVHIERLATESRLAPPPAEAPPEESPRGPAQPEASTDNPPSAARVFTSPMPGVIVSVAVEAGDQVVTGDEVCVLEAMKMQQVLRADWSGIVGTVHVGPGQQVLDGDPILDLG